MSFLYAPKSYCHLGAFSLALGYAYLAAGSMQAGGWQLLPFLVLLAAMSALSFALYWFAGYKNVALSAGFVLSWAVVYRLIALVGAPIMEDDQYRFMLDGCVFLEYGNPYGITPLSLFANNNLSPPCAALLNWVNNPDLATIYAPVLQLLFAVSSFIAPANVTLLQLLMAGFDLGIILILLRYAAPRKVLLYAACPLILKEFAFTAHPDVVAVLLLLGAFYLTRIGKPLLAATALASACAAKVFALILAPFLLLLLPRKAWGVFIAVLGAWYLPFLLTADGGASVLGGFASGWLFNPLGFLALTHLFTDSTARLLALAGFAAIWGLYLAHWWRQQIAHKAADKAADGAANGAVDGAVDGAATGMADGMAHKAAGAVAMPVLLPVLLPRGDFLFAAFLLLSPVFNPWYGVWILAFAALRPAVWSWAFSVALLLSYATGINGAEANLQAYTMADWAVALEIGIIAFAAAVSIYRHFNKPRFNQ